MGTKGSYSGGGGRIGDDLREGIDDWLASLPGAGAGSPAPPAEGPGAATPAASSTSSPKSKTDLSDAARRALPTAMLYRSSSGSRSGRNRSTNTAQYPRSAATSARTAGRGAAAAYAYRAGDADTLRDLGLDYDALRANPNIFDVAHQIAQKVCEDLPANTIATEELLHVVGDITEWLVGQDPGGSPPSPSAIAQETLALVLAWAYLTTTAAEVNTKDMTGQDRNHFEAGVRASCEELAALADLDVNRPTAAEFSAAIESGLETLQAIYRESDD